jgi:hypothetical protein
VQHTCIKDGASWLVLATVRAITRVAKTPLTAKPGANRTGITVNAAHARNLQVGFRKSAGAQAGHSTADDAGRPDANLDRRS